MTNGGAIDIRLVAAGDCQQVSIAPASRALPDALTRGRSPVALIGLLPRLFAVCAFAQGVAAAQACESAMGATPDPARAAKRMFLIRAEAAREHLLRLVIEVPKSLGEPPAGEDLAALRELAGALRRSAEKLSSAQWQRERRSIEQCLAALIARHFYRPANPVEPDGFMAWLAENGKPLARTCRRLIDHGEADLGADTWLSADVADIELSALVDQLLGPDGAVFAAMPDFAGQAPETTAFARQRDEALIAGLVGRFGDGLLSRLVARQLEVVKLADALAQGDDQAGDGGAAFELASGPCRDGESIASVETARGRLIHAVRLRDGLVADFRILAPTEWNFHPRGPVANRLAHLAGDSTLRASRARLLIDVFDPCVPYSLTVQ